jgi:hypothetical protein
MSTTLLPQAFWFRLAVPCPRIEGIPRRAAKSGLLDLPPSCRLPDLSTLDQGQTSWAKVGIAWNPNGIGISVRANAAKVDRLIASQTAGLAHVHIWIDTRDTRNVSRATRFCHRFGARVTLGRGKSLEVEVAQRPIARAIADAPMSRPDVFSAVAERSRDGWSLDWFIPAEALHGFDPETNRRLGFAYQISDYQRDDQFLAAGREFPVGENPSLWSTLELLD